MSQFSQPPSSEAPPDLPTEIENELYAVCFAEDRPSGGVHDLCEKFPDHRAEILRLATRLTGATSLVAKARRRAPPIEQPETVGPYRILRQLGTGGFGVVWLAEQTQPIRRQVACKVLLPNARSQRILQRFERERQTLAHLQHPCIASVLDAGTTIDGEAYFIMEYVDGPPITQYCDDRRLNVNARLQLFLRLCEGVQHAHQNGVIHRDLKPGNILVTGQDGSLPKIIDFGLAKEIGPGLSVEEAVTEAGHFVGTPEYMSPEQAAGEPIDTRTDVYALGVLLYELLTGELPFDSASLREGGWSSMLRIIRELEPTRPTKALTSQSDAAARTSLLRGCNQAELLQKVQGDLNWIVMTTLEKDRNLRYATVQELAADVRRHLQDLPVQVGPPSPMYRLRKFARRNKTAVVAGALIAGLILVGLIGSVYAVVQIVAARDEATSKRQQAEHNEHTANIAVAQAAMENHNVEHLRQVLTAVPTNRRGWEWRFLAARVDQSRRVVRLGRGVLIGGVAIRDGNSIVVDTGRDGEPAFAVVDTATGKVVARRKRPPGHVWRLSSSVDGSRFSINYANGQVHVFDAATLRQVRSFRLGNRHAASTFDSRTSSIAVSSGDAIRIYDLETGKALTPVMRPPHHDVQEVRFALGDSRLVSGSHGNGVFVWDASNGALVHHITKETRSLRTIEVSHDGTRVAAINNRDRTVRIWDVRTGDLLDKLKTHHLVSCAAFTADDKQIITGQADGSLTWWDLRHGTPLVTQHGHSKMIEQLCIPRSGNSVVSVSFDGTVRFWDSMPTLGNRTLARGETSLFIATDPDRPVFFRGSKTQITAATSDSGRHIWSTPTESPVHGLLLRPTAAELVVVDPFGRLRSVSTRDGALLHEGHKIDAPQSAKIRPYLSLSVDQERIAVSHGRRLNLYRAADLKLVRGVPLAIRTRVVFLNNDQIALRHSSRQVAIRDSQSGKTVRTHETKARIWSITGTADGSLLGVFDVEGRIFLYDAHGTLLRTLSAGAMLAFPVFSADNKYLVGYSHERRRFYLLDIAHGSELLSIRSGRGGWRRRIAFDASGRLLSSWAVSVPDGSHRWGVDVWNIAADTKLR